MTSTQQVLTCALTYGFFVQCTCTCTFTDYVHVHTVQVMRNLYNYMRVSSTSDFTCEFICVKLEN